MPGATHGTFVPVRNFLLAVLAVLMVGALLAIFGPRQVLEAEIDSALPVPKPYTTTTIVTGKIFGHDKPIRRELEASVPARLDRVLRFYRTELGKLGWKEMAEGAVVTPDRVQLGFTSSDGPAVLKLDRGNGKTSINLVLKFPDAAVATGVAPKPGRAGLMLASYGPGDATVSINHESIKIAGKAPRPLMLDLAPGKYDYTLEVAGEPARDGQVEIAADDTWELMVTSGGKVERSHVY